MILTNIQKYGYIKKIKHNICCISLYTLLRILYNSKFILMAISLGTNAVIVTRVHCIDVCINCWMSGKQCRSCILQHPIWVYTVYLSMSVRVLRVITIYGKVIQSTLFIPTLDKTTKFVTMTIWMSRTLRSRGDNWWEIMQEYCIKFQATNVLDIC